MRLRITYGSAAAFLADYRDQASRGGLLVRVAVADAERGAEVVLEIVTPGGRAHLSGQVLQALGDNGVAVAIEPGELSQLVRKAEARPDAGTDAETQHEVVGDGDSAPGAAASAEAAAGRDQAQQIQRALHGDKAQRMAIIRSPNKLLHGYVLRNPQIQLDEIAAIARMRTVSVEILNFIASKRDWCERPEVALALVRNPKTPVPLAVRMLDHVTMAELRQLAKQAGLREAVLRAVRKKVLG